MEGFRPLESGVPYFDQQLSIFLGATWTLCARWRYCMLEGWQFFLENTRHEGSIWFLQDIVRVFANIPSTIPQPFPKRSGKSPLMWGSCYCHPHAAGALGEGHLLESEMVSGGRHPFSNRWCSYPHFLAMKINRDNVPVFVAGGQKIPEHLQFGFQKPLGVQIQFQLDMSAYRGPYLHCCGLAFTLW